ncbi:hypothetical protein [Schaalia sp. Marseille-Q2122]|uniref:hypothetical protein n=1 Tax=Schaalia sp. Marseille-Q2122 TaxID=2736604 RepID=UPI00158F4B20|nr:hypothetical protein [Schaalia sp. Marseille-Q2122]
MRGARGRFRDLPWLWWILAGAYAAIGWLFAGAFTYQEILKARSFLWIMVLGQLLIAIGASGLGFASLLSAQSRMDCARAPKVERANNSIILRAGVKPDSRLSPIVGWCSGAAVFLGAQVVQLSYSPPQESVREIIVFQLTMGSIAVLMFVRAGVLVWLRSRRRLFPGDVVLSVEGVSQRVGDVVWEVAWNDIVHAAEAKKTVRGDVLLVARVVSGPVCRGWGCWWRRWGGVRARDFRLLASPLSFSLRPWETLIRLSRTPEWAEFITGPDAVERVRALFEAESFEDRHWPSYTPFENRGRYMHDLKNLP